VGCKTGFTKEARYCLVSCAEKDGLKLICVVMKDEDPYHYEDTISLFEYGFGNFKKVYIADTENEFSMDDSLPYIAAGEDTGLNESLLYVNPKDSMVMPAAIDFKDLKREIVYDSPTPGTAAKVVYSYNGVYLGEASIEYSKKLPQVSEIFGERKTEDSKSKKSFIYINIMNLGKILLVLGILILIALGVRLTFKFFVVGERSSRLPLTKEQKRNIREARRRLRRRSRRR
jgi:D-alanyl-D-alanine carboxypeptidase/D-alanyl-D-alanine carboxypeptidase (penicillin-binding protein 5/6)